METREQLDQRLAHEAVALGLDWGRANAGTPQLERVCAIQPEDLEGGSGNHFRGLAAAINGTALGYQQSCDVVINLWGPEDEAENSPQREEVQAFVRGASMAAGVAADARDLAEHMARSFTNLEAMVPEHETPRGAALMAGAIALGHLKQQTRKQAEEIDRLRDLVFKIVEALQKWHEP